MKIEDVINIIESKKIVSEGFLVSFDKITCGNMVMGIYVNGGWLVHDHFPDINNGETLIESEEEAWKLANDFKNSTDRRFCNICVTNEKLIPLSKKILRYSNLTRDDSVYWSRR